jgi:hypothetical protein
MGESTRESTREEMLVECECRQHSIGNTMDVLMFCILFKSLSHKAVLIISTYALNRHQPIEYNVAERERETENTHS